MAKWSKIMQISLLLIGMAYPDNLISKQSKKVRTLPQSSAVIKHQDPQEWYQKMMRKYPNVGLEKAELKEGPQSVGWSMTPSGYFDSKKAHIYCPSSTYSRIVPFTHADEFSLLHEVGHMRNHTWMKLFYEPKRQKMLACTLAVASFLGMNGVEKSKKLVFENALHLAENKTTIFDVVKNVFVFSMFYSLLSTTIYSATPHLLKQADERLADDFANKHADTSALIGGYKHFMEHQKQVIDIKENRKIPTWLLRILWNIIDVHPMSLDRAKKIEQTLNKKIGQTMPVVA